MNATKAKTDGYWLSTTDPEPGQTCEYQKQQKVNGRWTHCECGSSARVVITFPRITPGPNVTVENRLSLSICKECLLTLTKSLLTTLAMS